MTKPQSGEPGFPHWEDADYARRMRQHDHLFALLAIAAGLIFLQGYMIAPLIPRLATTGVILVLSLGYDLTQPLFVGIVTDLSNPTNLGQTMGLKVFTLFTGFGIGSWLFGEALRWGFEPTLAIFAGVQLLAAIAAIPLFWQEKPVTSSSTLAPE